MVTVSQFPEHNNVFHGMLAHQYYHSPASNRIFVRNTAARAGQAELDDVSSYMPDDHRRLYNVVRQGLPMNPQEVHDLAALIANPCESALDRAEGFLLLGEL